MSYAKISTRGVFSENSDYSMPSNDTKTDELGLTPTIVAQGTLHLSTAAQTLDLSGFTTITSMILVNKSATAVEVVTATWYSALGTITSGAATPTAFVEGGVGVPDTITRAAADFITSGAVINSYVRVVGADEAANDATWPIQAAAAGTLTVDEASDLAADADDQGVVLYIESRNIQPLAAGAQLVVSSAVPQQDLSLISASGTPILEYFIVGT